VTEAAPDGVGRPGPVPVAPGLLLGIGLGGFVDGILLHQILQWHHMLTATDRYPSSTIVGLEAKFSIPADVVEMFPRSSQIIAGARQHFDDHFRRTLHSPPDVLDLRSRQSATILARATPPVAHNIEQWLLDWELKCLRQNRSPNSLRSPSVAPSCCPEALRRS
jgi:hypothetical protein